jgi:hypothetical protein
VPLPGRCCTGGFTGFTRSLSLALSVTDMSGPGGTGIGSYGVGLGGRNRVG